MRAVVFGASGLVGAEICRILAQNPSITELVPVVRKKSHSKIPNHSLEIDYSNVANIKELIRRDDLVFCALGTTIKKAKTHKQFSYVDHQIPLAIGKICQCHNVQSFAIVSALGAKADSSIFYLKVKGALETDLKALSLRRLVIVRPSLLLGKRAQERFLEGLGQKLMPLLNRLLTGPLKKYRAIPAQEVAQAMIELTIKGKSVVAVEIEISSIQT